MQLKATLFILTIILFQSCSGQVKNENNQKNVEFLKNFYHEYVTKTNDPNNGHMVFPILKKYCTKDLYDSLVRKMKTYEIDFNPILYAQDFHVSLLDNLNIIQDSLKTNSYIVSYYYEDLENWKSTHIIKYELINTQDSIKIKNIGGYELR